MINQPFVVSISISPGGIPKHPIDSACVTFDGLLGDGHNHEKHRKPIQAVCLQDWEHLEQLYREGYTLKPGTIGENLTVRGLHVQDLAIGTQLQFSGGILLELTKERKPCYVLDSIDPRLKQAIVGRCGMYAKVLRQGLLTRGETIEIAQPSRMLAV